MSLALSSLAIAVLAAVLYALFQKSAPTFSLLVSMAAALILLARVGSAAQSVLSGLARLEQRAGGDAYGCLLRCTQRTDLGYDSYEEVKNSIILEEAQKVLQASIEERVQDASVFFVSDKYEQIIVE